MKLCPQDSGGSHSVGKGLHEPEVLRKCSRPRLSTTQSLSLPAWLSSTIWQSSLSAKTLWGQKSVCRDGYSQVPQPGKSAYHLKAWLVNKTVVCSPYSYIFQCPKRVIKRSRVVHATCSYFQLAEIQQRWRNPNKCQLPPASWILKKERRIVSPPSFLCFICPVIQNKVLFTLSKSELLWCSKRCNTCVSLCLLMFAREVWLEMLLTCK